MALHGCDLSQYLVDFDGVTRGGHTEFGMSMDSDNSMALQFTIRRSCPRNLLIILTEHRRSARNNRAKFAVYVSNLLKMG